MSDVAPPTASREEANTQSDTPNTPVPQDIHPEMEEHPVTPVAAETAIALESTPSSSVPTKFNPKEEEVSQTQDKPTVSETVTTTPLEPPAAQLSMEDGQATSKIDTLESSDPLPQPPQEGGQIEANEDSVTVYELQPEAPPVDDQIIPNTTTTTTTTLETQPQSLPGEQIVEPVKVYELQPEAPPEDDQIISQGDELASNTDISGAQQQSTPGDEQAVSQEVTPAAAALQAPTEPQLHLSPSPGEIQTLTDTDPVRTPCEPQLTVSTTQLNINNEELGSVPQSNDLTTAVDIEQEQSLVHDADKSTNSAVLPTTDSGSHQPSEPAVLKQSEDTMPTQKDDKEESQENETPKKKKREIPDITSSDELTAWLSGFNKDLASFVQNRQKEKEEKEKVEEEIEKVEEQAKMAQQEEKIMEEEKTPAGDDIIENNEQLEPELEKKVIDGDKTERAPDVNDKEAFNAWMSKISSNIANFGQPPLEEEGCEQERPRTWRKDQMKENDKKGSVNDVTESTESDNTSPSTEVQPETSENKLPDVNNKAELNAWLAGISRDLEKLAQRANDDQDIKPIAANVAALRRVQIDSDFSNTAATGVVPEIVSDSVNENCAKQLKPILKSEISTPKGPTNKEVAHVTFSFKTCAPEESLDNVEPEAEIVDNLEIHEAETPSSLPVAVVDEAAAPCSEEAVQNTVEATPLSDTTAPVSEAAAPITDGVAPLSEAAPPITDEPAPQAEAADPQAESVAPQAESVAPQIESVAPLAEAVAPQAESVAPQAEAVAPQAEAIAPLAEAAAPIAQALRAEECSLEFVLDSISSIEEEMVDVTGQFARLSTKLERMQRNLIKVKLSTQKLMDRQIEDTEIYNELD